VSSAIRFLLRVVLLPVTLLRLAVRALGRLLGRFLKPFSGLVDSSGRLSNAINSLSSSMATQRGLLLALSLVTSGVVLVLMVSTDKFDRSLYWLCIPFALLHLGVLAGFTGLMLATPLGQGYKDK
jgi:ABC-type polysaccharide/polyol phosphate export permease